MMRCFVCGKRPMAAECRMVCITIGSLGICLLVVGAALLIAPIWVK